tara:strand:- start:2187 stop:4007 length:1821 start_codon:yes stop_codon:yes gene_type:complete
MAKPNVQKKGKLNAYKFVGTEEPKGRGSNPFGATGHFNENTQAINALGASVNGIMDTVQKLKEAQLAEFEARQKDKPKKNLKYGKTKKKKGKGNPVLNFAKSVTKAGGSFLSGILGMLGNMLKMAIAIPALMWLAKPENKEKIVTLVKVLSKIGKFVFDFAQFGITQTLDGLYMMLSGETKWWEKLLGFGKALLGLSTIILGIGFLKNPLGMIKKIKAGVKILIGILKRQALKNSLPIPGKAEGGVLPKPRVISKSLKSFAKGGWIQGPQSGYPVSLDGGRSTSFIGHGTEYVSQKADGGAFIVPFDTPATRRDPSLTEKRAKEANKLGFSEGGLLDVPKLSIPTFSEGGFVPFDAPSLPHFSVPQFSTGGGLNVSTPSIPKFDLPNVKPIEGFSVGGVVNNFKVPVPSLPTPVTSPIQYFAQGGQYKQTYSPSIAAPTYSPTISTSVLPSYSFSKGGVLPTPKFVVDGHVLPRFEDGGEQVERRQNFMKNIFKTDVIGNIVNKVKNVGSSVVSKVTEGRNNQANKSRDAMMQQLEATAGQVAAVNEQNQNAIAQAEAMTGGGEGGSSEPVLKGMPGLGTYNQNGVLKTTSTVLNSNNNSMRGLLK